MLTEFAVDCYLYEFRLLLLLCEDRHNIPPYALLCFSLDWLVTGPSAFISQAGPAPLVSLGKRVM
jgi:hypothetical protein